MRTPTRLSRRDFLKLGAAAAALASCNRLPNALTLTRTATRPTPPTPPTPTAPNASLATLTPTSPTPRTSSSTPSALSAPSALSEHSAPSALSALAAARLTFGARPGDLQRIDGMGLDAFIEEQLAPERIDDGALQQRLAGFDFSALNAEPAEIAAQKGAPLLLPLQQHTLLRAVYSERQLYELMVDFWTNHFNIYFRAGPVKYLKHIDDRDVIRPHALGRFRDLLGASAQSPAMLMYLDNASNKAGNPNENYARELMELHTIGVDGGYTQQDVAEAARALTGWSLTGPRGKQSNAGTFVFRPRQHDDDAKAILGVAFPAGGGQRDGEQLLDLLAKHPACGTFISLKLARRFVADQPPATVVEAGATAFKASGGDIRTTLGAILHSDGFRQSSGAKLKRPLEFLASALRALNADTDGGRQLQTALQQMGQPLFLWSPPNGYPDVSGAWSGAGTLLARWNTALALTSNTLKGTRVTLDRNADIDALAQTLFGAPLPATTRAALEPFANARQRPALAALMLCAPLFQLRG